MVVIGVAIIVLVTSQATAVGSRNGAGKLIHAANPRALSRCRNLPLLGGLADRTSQPAYSSDSDGK